MMAEASPDILACKVEVKCWRWQENIEVYSLDNHEGAILVTDYPGLQEVEINYHLV